MSTLNLGNPPFVRRGDGLTAASRPPLTMISAHVSEQPVVTPAVT